MRSIFRLCSARFEARSGAGAALFGGRWNPVGIEAIYAAESRSLAALEILVHFDVLPSDFVLTEIVLPDGLRILEVNADDLGEGWDAQTYSAATQEIGRRFAEERRYAVLSVPSTVIPWEQNFVLNPEHESFGSIRFGPPMPFRFDPRLK